MAMETKQQRSPEEHHSFFPETTYLVYLYFGDQILG